MSPNYTSQDCSVCGDRNKLLKLSDREWTCVNGHKLDRDLNAAVNIKNKGIGHIPLAWEVYNSVSRVAQEFDNSKCQNPMTEQIN